LVRDQYEDARKLSYYWQNSLLSKVIICDRHRPFSNVIRVLTLEGGVLKNIIIEYVRMKYNAEMIIHQGVLVSRVEEKKRRGPRERS